MIRVGLDQCVPSSVRPGRADPGSPIPGSTVAVARARRRLAAGTVACRRCTPPADGGVGRVGRDPGLAVLAEEDVAGLADEGAVAAVARRGRLLLGAALGALDPVALLAGLLHRLLALVRGSRRAVAEIPRDELGQDSRLREGGTAVRRLRHDDRVHLVAAAALERAPRDVDGADAGDADVAELAAVHALGDLLRLRVRDAAVGGAEK